MVFVLLRLDNFETSLKVNLTDPGCWLGVVGGPVRSELVWDVNSY